MQIIIYNCRGRSGMPVKLEPITDAKCLCITSQEYQVIIRKESALLACEKNTSGSRPKELFEDAMEEAEAQYEKDKQAIKNAVKEGNFGVEATTSFDEFCEALLGGLDAEAKEKLEGIIQPNK
jgi:pre-mRNA-processing factor 40